MPESNTAQDATDGYRGQTRSGHGIYSGRGRHQTHMGRSIRGARTTPAADLAQPPPAAPPPARDVHPPNGRGVNPS